MTEMNILEEQKNPVMCRESRSSAILPPHFVKLYKYINSLDLKTFLLSQKRDVVYLWRQDIFKAFPAIKFFDECGHRMNSVIK